MKVRRARHLVPRLVWRPVCSAALLPPPRIALLTACHLVLMQGKTVRRAKTAWVSGRDGDLSRRRLLAALASRVARLRPPCAGCVPACGNAPGQPSAALSTSHPGSRRPACPLRCRRCLRRSLLRSLLARPPSLPASDVTCLTGPVPPLCHPRRFGTRSTAASSTRIKRAPPFWTLLHGQSSPAPL